MATWSDKEKEEYEERRKLEMPLSEISGLSVRIINTLEDAGVLLVKDLLAKTVDELLSVANFGEKTLLEVRQALRNAGLKPSWKIAAKRRKNNERRRNE